jgi:membrane carboxypeptidase/penicillin-binding protein PbpC
MINYTPEQVDWMSNLYNQTPSRQTVEDIANILEKSTKSVIGKLAREGIYQKAEYISKTGEKPVTKIQLVQILAQHLGIPIDNLTGLEKAPKGVLKLLCQNL